MTESPIHPWRITVRTLRSRQGRDGHSRKVRRVALHLGSGVTVTMTPDRALELANELVDVAEALDRKAPR